MIDNDTIHDILSRLDIVDVISRYITVSKKGKNYVAICPFHNDTNPSLSISKDKQIFKCFVCGKGGNLINFIADYEKISYVDAIYKAAEYAGIQLKKEVKQQDERYIDLKKIFADAVEYYSFAVNSNKGLIGADYCKSRHLDDEVRERFKIGYSPVDGKETIDFLRSSGNSIAKMREIGLVNNISENAADINKGRLIFTITNRNNEPVAISARKITADDGPKYVNSPESPIFHKSNILYNFYYAKQSAKIDGYIYLLEGFMDVIALYRAGITSAVGLMGTALSKEHIALLKFLNVEVRLCLDFDTAGQQAMVEICQKFDEQSINYRIVKKTDIAKDSDEILNKYGKDALKNVLNNLVSKQEFLLDFYSSHYNTESDEEKKAFIRSFLPIMAKCTSNLYLENYAMKLASITNYSKNSILEEYKSYVGSDSKINKFDKKAPSKLIEINEIGQYTLSKSKISKLETELMYHILKNEDALIYYEKNIEYFYDKVFSKIILYFENYHNDYNNLNISNFLNYLYGNVSENDAENYVEIVTKILTDNIRHEKYTPTLMVSIKNQLKIEKDYLFKERELDRKFSEEIDNIKKLSILKDKASIKKEKMRQEDFEHRRSSEQ